MSSSGEGGGMRDMLRNARNAIPKVVDKAYVALLEAIPSSARDLEQYRVQLFPEFETDEKLLDYLQGRFTIDIGSGLTHANPYSLISVMTKRTGKSAVFLGIEPKAGGVPKGFSNIDTLLSLVDVLLSTKREKGSNAENRVVAAELPHIPFPEGSVDLIISSFLIGRWIKDPRDLLLVFEEFDRLLSSEGEIRLHPFPEELLIGQLSAFVNDRFVRVSSGEKLLLLKRKNT